jgi:hypothetical protein
MIQRAATICLAVAKFKPLLERCLLKGTPFDRPSKVFAARTNAPQKSPLEENSGL